MNDETKPWYQSRTLWGAAILIVSTALQQFGVAVSAEEQTQAVNALGVLGDTAGLIMVIWGRVSASKRITAPKDSGNA